MINQFLLRHLALFTGSQIPGCPVGAVAGAAPPFTHTHWGSPSSAPLVIPSPSESASHRAFVNFYKITKYQTGYSISISILAFSVHFCTRISLSVQYSDVWALRQHKTLILNLQLWCTKSSPPYQRIAITKYRSYCSALKSPVIFLLSYQ
mgnify:CR=1 FL=1